MLKKTLWGLGALVAVAVAAIAYWAVSPYFIHIKADDARPSGPAGVAVETSAVARVQGTAGHPASGAVRLFHVEGKIYLRYENFKTVNGPDLFVYLAKDKDAKEFINLGPLRATEGNINYEIPDTIDVSQYPYVLVWCRTFSVLFNYTKLF